ncbi:hypothetical protein M5X66_17615 [Providencia sp. PROV188]|uniref:hypothetical protein n=1 Tax=Providencia sp. PROV188 TaxID=2939731 RepID=UPI0022DD7574|nr:hypothetical protein [Providencia sp. PROV188]WBM60752.1 hypothetical protein M5X66_17615 [Providencia sp. PROV188]
MLDLKFNIKFLTIHDKWLYKKSSFCDLFKFVAYKGGNLNKRPFLFITRKKRSVRNDLSLSNESLWLNLRKNTRYDINKAKELDTKFNLINCIDSKENNNSEIVNFISDYNFFVKNKELPIPLLTDKRILKYRKNLVISKINHNNTWLAQHAYLVIDNYAELLYSIVNSQEDNKLTGLANKHLHWNDFLSLKNIGISLYDWGGITIDGSLAGIRNFKLSFGGDDVTYNIYNSPLYQLALNIKKS